MGAVVIGIQQPVGLHPLIKRIQHISFEGGGARPFRIQNHVIDYFDSTNCLGVTWISTFPNANNWGTTKSSIGRNNMLETVFQGFADSDKLTDAFYFDKGVATLGSCNSGVFKRCCV